MDGALFAIPYIEEAQDDGQDPDATPTGQYKSAVLSDIALQIRGILCTLDWEDPRAAAVLTALSAVADRIPSTAQPAQLVCEALQVGFAAVEDDPNAPSCDGGWHYSLFALVLIASLLAHRTQCRGLAYQASMLEQLEKELAWIVYGVAL